MTVSEHLQSAAGSPPVRIGVVGGAGQMGNWLRRFWQDRGFEVRYSDRDTPLSNEDVVRWAQLTFVSVPLHATPAVLRELASGVVGDRALVSIASLMGPSAEALAGVPAEAICAHPVFGPTVTGTASLPVVVAPVRGERWSQWLVQTLRAAGLSVHVSTPQAHDTKMALVQAMVHSLYVALCQTLCAAELPPPEALPWSSPTMHLQLGLAARILSQDAELYADLVVDNPRAPEGLELLSSKLQHLAALARAGDRAGFIAAFADARESFAGTRESLATDAEAALAQLA